MDFYLARVADKIERPQDVVRWMNNVVNEKRCLNANERNLWASGHRDYASSIRNALRTLKSYRDECTEYEFKMAIDELMAKYLEELDDFARRSIRVIDQVLIPEATKSATAGVYQKVKADLLRYSAEFSQGKERQDKIDRSIQAYRAALQLAARDVTKADPIFLGIALNYAVCEVELCGRIRESRDPSRQMRRGGS